MPAAQSLSQALEPLRLRYYDSPVPGWLRLVGEALLSALPLGLRRQLGATRRQLLLGLRGDGLQLSALVDEKESVVGTVPVDDLQLLEDLRARLDSSAANVPRWLLLDAGQALRPVLSVPSTAESRLREVMAHEIDRQTPFALEQVSFEPRVLARDSTAKQMRVELVVLPLQRLEAALQSLGPMSAGLAGVDVVDTQGVRLGVNLLPLSGRALRTNHGRAINRGLAAIAVVVMLTAMWLVLDNRRAAHAAHAARLATATVEARESRKLRNALEGSVRAANFLARQRAQQPTMLELLADLTRRVPDSTALEKIAINGGNIVLIGQSQQASALVGLLQDSPLIKKPTLTGSVQADPRTGKERFTLTAVVAGGDSEKEAARGSSRTP